jgi:hypothetical protein
VGSQLVVHLVICNILSQSGLVCCNRSIHLFLVIGAFFFYKLRLETLFSSVGKINQEVSSGGSFYVRVLRALGQPSALAWSSPELILLIEEAGFIY